MGDAAFTALTTQRLVLRRFRPQDLDAFVAYRSDPEIARYQGWEVPYRRGQAQQFLQELEAIDPDTPGEWFQFAISLRGADGLIGDCGAQVRTEDSRQAEIGFTLAPQHQGYGYATEAVRRLLHYLLIERGKHRSGPPAMTATRARPPCWSWWACAARATCWRAPGPRASGPTTCCMASCDANGPPAPEPSVRHGTSVPLDASPYLHANSEHESQQEVAGSSPAKGTSTPTSSAAPPVGRARHGTAGAATA
jgi:GNAT superfamily N-acetyltransferase